MRRRTASAVVITALTAALAGSAVAAAPSRAAAGGADPAAQAAALALRVRALQVRAEAETQRYDSVQAELGELITRHLLASDSLQQAQSRLAATTGTEDAGLRALYESGGSLGLLAGVLQPGGLAAIPQQTVTVSRLLASEEQVSRGQLSAAHQVASTDVELGRLAAAQTRLSASVGSAANQVESDLSGAQALLAQANARVRALEVAQAAALAREGSQQLTGQLPAGPFGLAPATPIAAAAIRAIKTKLGTPYQWGGTGPDAYDCSGLVGFAYEAAGVNMPRTAAQQYLAGTHPTLGQLRPGDLLFWGTTPGDPASIYHVAMYAGGNLMWSDDQPGDVARLQPIWGYQFYGTTRIVPAMAAAVPGPRWEAG